MSEPINEQFNEIGDPGLLSMLALAIILGLAYPLLVAWKKVSG